MHSDSRDPKDMLIWKQQRNQIQRAQCMLGHHVCSLDTLVIEEQLALKNRALAACAEGITISDYRLPDHPLIYANEGFKRLTGYQVDEVIGRNCRFLQGPATDPTAVQEIRTAIAEERACTVELLNYRKDGSAFWNRLSITPIRDDIGVATHFVGIQSNVTDRRLAEDELRIANRRMKQDLEAAAAIQQTLLPQQVKQIADVELAWHFHPCDELAGDFLNVFALNKSNIGFYVLDVSGHGVPAALLSVSLSRTLSPTSPKSLLFVDGTDHGGSARIAQPTSVFEKLNSEYQMDLEKPQFFTMQYGIYSLRDQLVRYVSAGHPPPIFAKRHARPVTLESGQCPIGVIGDPAYQEYELKMQSEDRLFLYTDGVMEAQNPSGEQFGLERLLQAIDQVCSEPLEHSLDSLWRIITDWSGGRPLADDVSMLALRGV